MFVILQCALDWQTDMVVSVVNLLRIFVGDVYWAEFGRCKKGCFPLWVSVRGKCLLIRKTMSMCACYDVFAYLITLFTSPLNFLIFLEHRKRGPLRRPILQTRSQWCKWVSPTVQAYNCLISLFAYTWEAMWRLSNIMCYGLYWVEKFFSVGVEGIFLHMTTEHTSHMQIELSGNGRYKPVCFHHFLLKIQQCKVKNMLNFL